MTTGALAHGKGVFAVVPWRAPVRIYQADDCRPSPITTALSPRLCLVLTYNCKIERAICWGALSAGIMNQRSSDSLPIRTMPV